MSYNIKNEVALHHAGSTVRNKSPFSNISVPSLDQPLSKAHIEKWVIPFYRYRIRSDSDEFAVALRPIFHEIDDDLITMLLSEFNWRPHIVAAYFAAITNRGTHQEHIGKLLLRCDVCNAGRGYCLALAQFNTVTSLKYLTDYLDYYLLQPELYFDQGFAMAAVAYMDSQNKTNYVARFMPAWSSFTEDKKNWSLDCSIELFSNQMRAINSIAQNVGR